MPVPTWLQVTLCRRLASRRPTWRTADMLSHEGCMLRGVYRMTTGCTGAPARKAPVLKGSRQCPFVVVPCVPYMFLAIRSGHGADSLFSSKRSFAAPQLHRQGTVLSSIQHGHAPPAETRPGATSGKSSNGRMSFLASPFATDSTRFFTCKAAPCGRAHERHGT